MSSFMTSGFLQMHLFPGHLAEAAISEIDEAEYKEWVTKESDKIWIPLSLPDGPATAYLRQTVDKVNTRPRYAENRC